MTSRLTWLPAPALGLVLALGTHPVAAQMPVPAALDSVFGRRDRTDRPGCIAGVDVAGRRTIRAYGMSNLEDGIALSPESISESGSVAKQFTAAAVGLLVLRGKLSLDDDIRKYLPEVPDFGTTITVRHLLTHTSGLRDQWGLLGLQGHPPGEEVHTLDRILRLVSRQRRLNFRPGDEYLYSNTGFALTAILVGRVAGKSLAEFARDELFRPLGMTHTEWRDDYRRVVPGRATAYDREHGAWVQDMPFTMVYGNGGLLSTAGDWLTWNAALTDGTVPGGMPLVRMLETPGRLNDGSPINYALGLVVGTFRGLREVSHNGATAGYRTALARWPDRGLSVAILCNAADANPQADARLLARLVLALPDSETPPAPAVAIDARRLDSLAGRYRDSTSDQMVTFAVKNGTLTVAGNGPATRLTHLGELRFWSPVAGEFRFEQRAGAWQVTQFQNAWRHYAPLVPVDSATVRPADYVGSYHSPELDVDLTVLDQAGTVTLELPLGERIPLEPLYRDGFAGPGTVRFDRDRRGRVVRLRVFAGRVRDVEFDRRP
jgi:CubicO group peptidase (beta-lactamase class C family)